MRYLILSDLHANWDTLAAGPIEISNELHICHGSPLDEDGYVFSINDAYEVFSKYSADVIFFGHTHIPSLFELHSGGIEVEVVQGESFTLATPGPSAGSAWTT